jgi:hypothetical protein
MAAFSSFHFSGSGARSQCAPGSSTRSVKSRRTTDLTDIAVRVRGAAGKAVLLLWTALALSFSLLVLVGFFL